MKQTCLGAALVALTLFALNSGTSAANAAGATIAVTHELDAARPREVISVPFAQIASLMPEARMYHLVVRDSKGRVLPSQITNYEHDHRGAQYDDLVFSYDFAAGEKRATFTLENLATASPPEAPCTYARLVPERFDDIAWENDRIAHRMYGLALNSPRAGGERLRGSGIDVWAKRVTYPIVDRWYAKGHDQFHKDEEGEGLDLYSIGGSRGAGGTGVWDGAKLWTSDNFVGAQVLSNGPRRAAFKLTYAPWDAGSAGQVIETKRFTVDCGSNLDAVESVFDFVPDNAVVGIGISEHPPAAGFPAAVLTKDPDGRWLSFWEENKDGGLGVAVILASDTTPAGFAHEDAPGGKGNANNLILAKGIDGVPLRYFTGAGWTKSGQFDGRAAWETYVKDFSARVRKPLSINVSASK
ncbi:MAG TPA: DUF4861 family protein [Steroidobacteraceae bacterium]